MVENIRKEKRYEVSEEQLQLFIFKVTYQSTKLLLIMGVAGIFYLIRKTRH